MKNIRKVLRTLFILDVICSACWLIIHRRVLKALITGKEMPEPPAWHKKMCHKK